MENTDELRHVLQQIQNAIEGEPQGLKEAWNLLSDVITELEKPIQEPVRVEEVRSADGLEYLNKINFWQRLEMFVENVQVNDAMSEEEKEMIIRIAQQFFKNASQWKKS